MQEEDLKDSVPLEGGWDDEEQLMAIDQGEEEDRPPASKLHVLYLQTWFLGTQFLWLVLNVIVMPSQVRYERIPLDRKPLVKKYIGFSTSMPFVAPAYRHARVL